MSLDKAIEYGKEHRKPYYKFAGDRSCRPHGGCSWCRGNRLRYKRIAALNEQDQYDWAEDYFEQRFRDSDYLLSPPIMPR